MGEWFASGRIVDAILVLMVAEFAGLAFLRKRTGRGADGVALLAVLGAGACLMLALRGALVGAPWPWIAAALAGAFLAHAADLALRFRG